ncbi:hypothetical protein BDC45DRAFT_501766 [Circinella umbellata]|nr:hypothetical protein BDC45DRAFT_501766 [Circinella umbellata]
MTVAIYNQEVIDTDDKVVNHQQQSSLSPPFFYPEASLDDVIKKAQFEATEAKKNPHTFKKPIQRVAVIGAGPSGLPTAKALKEHGLEVRIFERMGEVGGNWVYSEESPLTPSIPSDNNPAPRSKQDVLEKQKKEDGILMEANHKERMSHAPSTACYAGLHNNTAAPIMLNYEDFPWPENTPWYISHTRVHQYFKDYANEYGLYDLVELNTNVEFVERKQQSTEEEKEEGWELTVRKREELDNGMARYKSWTESFDAVVMASGGFHRPQVPEFKHLREYNEQWPERIIHSKQYRRHTDFVGKNVLIVGGNASGVDIAFHLEGTAKNVYMVIRNEIDPSIEQSTVGLLLRSMIPDNVIRKRGIVAFSNLNGDVDGSITFNDGTVVNDIDTVIFATGFITDFEYFGPLQAVRRNQEQQQQQEKTKENGDATEEPLVISNGRRVLNTYQEVFLIRDPTLAFVGVPGHIINTAFFYYQAQAVARVWSGSAFLPSQQKMQEYVDSTTLYPSFPDDVNLQSGILHSQRFVTWLNDHANYIANNKSNEEEKKKELYTLKGIDPNLNAKWVEIRESWPQRSLDVKKALKEI